MRLALAIMLLATLLGSHGTLAGSRLPEDVSIFITSWTSLGKLENDSFTGWPITYPIKLFTEAHIFDLELGPDGYLYMSFCCRENKIVRCTQTGECTDLYCNSRLYPADLEFGEEGVLFFSTLPREGIRGVGDRSMGVWTINVHDLSPEATLVVGSEVFKTHSRTPEHGWPTLCYISTGLRAGSLLITFAEAAPILRLDPPDYESVVPFTDERLPARKGFFLAMLNDSTILVADEEAGVISRFDVEGNYLGVFADCGVVFQLKTDSRGRVYATRRDNGLTILSPEGEEILEIGIPIFGIAIVED